MNDRVHNHPNLIYSEGTQVVALRDVVGLGGRIQHLRGAVGIVIRSPVDLDHAYRIRFLDGAEEMLRPDEIDMLARYQEGRIGTTTTSTIELDLRKYLVFRCVIGSRAYGLEHDQSDTDYRGIFLPPADLHWSLYGVPEQIEFDETQEHYWELQRFLVLALKANPNVLECLYSPLIEKTTPLIDELLEMKSIFLSRLVYQTYNGYVMSQFKKMQADLRNQHQVKWKHVMHLIRLLLSGISVLRNGFVPVRVGEHRDQLLAIKRGELSLDWIESWRIRLHAEFDQALSESILPERPDYERANTFLIKARHSVFKEESR